MNYTYLETPIGTLLIAGDTEAVRRIDFPKDACVLAVLQA